MIYLSSLLWRVEDGGGGGGLSRRGMEWVRKAARKRNWVGGWAAVHPACGWDEDSGEKPGWEANKRLSRRSVMIMPAQERGAKRIKTWLLLAGSIAAAGIYTRPEGDLHLLRVFICRRCPYPQCACERASLVLICERYSSNCEWFLSLQRILSFAHHAEGWTWSRAE